MEWILLILKIIGVSIFAYLILFTINMYFVIMPEIEESRREFIAHREAKKALNKIKKMNRKSQLRSREQSITKNDESIFIFLCENCGLELTTILSFANDKTIECIICGYKNIVSYQTDGLVRLNKTLAEREELLKEQNKISRQQDKDFKENGRLYPHTAAGRYYDEMVAEGKWPPRKEAS